MGIFKRICMLIYSLAGFVLFGAFIISTQASMTPLAQYVMTYAVVRHALPACGVILFIGCVVMFLRAVFTRNRRVVIITKTKDNQITVSRNAILSQATHVIEEDGRFRVISIYCKMRKYGHIRLSVRTQPLTTEDLIQAGQELHDRLMQGLVVVVGNNVDAIKIEFSRAGSYAQSLDEGYADEEELYEDLSSSDIQLPLNTKAPVQAPFPAVSASPTPKDAPTHKPAITISPSQLSSHRDSVSSNE